MWVCERSLKAVQLFNELRLTDCCFQLDYESVGGEDERRMLIEALQDISCRRQKHQCSCSLLHRNTVCVSLQKSDDVDMYRLCARRWFRRRTGVHAAGQERCGSYSLSM